MEEESADIIDAFTQQFGCAPQYLVRCPGRVNLIGEHIDYNGYGVLPMAIEQSVRAAVACRPEANTIRLANLDPNYPPYERVVTDLSVDREQPAWHQYFMCGYRGIVEELQIDPPKGMCVLLSGNVPPSAGLSSSSALVCCAALCSLLAQTGGQSFQRLTRERVAEVCAACERHIGTQGGGMDQAACLLACKQQALRIDFAPLRSQPVTLPATASFVVCHSCSELNKAATSQFNDRVIECRLATKVLAHSQSVDWRDIAQPGDLQRKLGLDLVEIQQLVTAQLHDHPYSLAEVCGVLGCSEQELWDNCFSENMKHLRTFHLQQRLLHVFGEAHRVQAFALTCASPADADLAELGVLMNNSHFSCARLYECSCPELDELVNDARAAGACGARLTGAGWGGCVVALVPTQLVPTFLQNIANSFYARTPERKAALAQGNRVFATQPAAGAEVFTL